MTSIQLVLILIGVLIISFFISKKLSLTIAGIISLIVGLYLMVGGIIGYMFLLANEAFLSPIQWKDIILISLIPISGVGLCYLGIRFFRAVVKKRRKSE